MRLFVGLGNPGPAYADTRHNIGWRVIEEMRREHAFVDVSNKKFYGRLLKFSDNLLLQPLTYMNDSGRSVRAVMDFYKISLEDIVVIHDDLDLAFGALRFKRGGGHGGHNGLKSLDSAIGKEYIRVRMGIGRPKFKSAVVDFVLESFSESEEKVIGRWVEYTASVCWKIPSLSLDEVKSRYSLKSIESLP